MPYCVTIVNEMEEKFYQWLTEQLDKHGWSYSEFGRQADISPSLISLVMSGQRDPTADFCLATAKALGADPSFVLGLAGHLPPTITEQIRADPLLRELARIWGRLSKFSQRLVVRLAHGLDLTTVAYESEAEMERVPEHTIAPSRPLIITPSEPMIHQLVYWIIALAPPERREELVEHFIDVAREYGYPGPERGDGEGDEVNDDARGRAVATGEPADEMPVEQRAKLDSP